MFATVFQCIAHPLRLFHGMYSDIRVPNFKWISDSQLPQTTTDYLSISSFSHRRKKVSAAYLVYTHCSVVLIIHSCSTSDMIIKGFNILLQHPSEANELSCTCVFSVCACASAWMHVWVRFLALSRCAGMAVCCNASCFANCRRSQEGCDTRLRG